MSTFKTESLVLAKKSVKEADRIYILYTKDYGKVEAKVRSAASSKSKLAGHLEPFCQAQVMIARGKSLETIAGAMLIKNFSFHNWEILNSAGLAGELVIRAMRNDLPQPEIYQLLKSFLEALEIRDRQPMNKTEIERLSLLNLRFIWQVLIHLGYRVDLENGRLINLTAAAKELLNDCLVEKEKLTNLHSSFKVIREVVDFTQAYLRFFLEVDLKSYYSNFYATIN